MILGESRLLIASPSVLRGAECQGQGQGQSQGTPAGLLGGSGELGGIRTAQEGCLVPVP